MYAKPISILACALLVAAPAPALADHDFVRPLNIDKYAPAENVPRACASFYSETGWGNGAWDERRPHELHITEIDADCNAKLLYGYGSWDHDGTGEWLALRGVIRGDELKVAIDIYEADVVYVLTDDATLLLGTFTSRDATRHASVRLSKI